MAYGEEQSIRILPSQSHGHEAERRVDLLVDDGEAEPVALGDRAPSSARPRRPSGSTPMRTPARADRVQVDHVGRGPRRRPRRSRDACVVERGAPARRASRCTPSRPAASSALARSWIHARDVGVGRAAVRRVVLEAAVLGRVVRRRDDDAVGEPRRPPAVVGEDGVGDGGRRRVAVARVEHDGRRRSRRAPRARSRSAGSDSAWVSMPRNSGPSMPCAGAVVADRLGDGQDVASLNAPSNAEPRWPDVPNATRWAATDTSGRTA